MNEYRENAGKRPLSFDTESQTLTLTHPDQRQLLEEKLEELSSKYQAEDKKMKQEQRSDFFEYYTLNIQILLIESLLANGTVQLDKFYQGYPVYQTVPSWRKNLESAVEAIIADFAD